MDKVRIDKWLWAARLFKTRSLAKQAIDGGKVQCDGQRVKPSKDVVVGNMLIVTRGWDKTEIRIDQLSDQRRGAPEAQQLYTETAASIEARTAAAAARKAAGGRNLLAEHRPNKKQRRQIHRFRDLLNKSRAEN